MGSFYEKNLYLDFIHCRLFYMGDNMVSHEDHSGNNTTDICHRVKVPFRRTCFDLHCSDIQNSAVIPIWYEIFSDNSVHFLLCNSFHFDDLWRNIREFCLGIHNFFKYACCSFGYVIIYLEFKNKCISNIWFSSCIPFTDNYHYTRI